MGSRCSELSVEHRWLPVMVSLLVAAVVEGQ